MSSFTTFLLARFRKTSGSDGITLLSVKPEGVRKKELLEYGIENLILMLRILA